jgi:intraflagellar transport protein 88
MGNVYFEQGKFPSAIKMYRMALDALPPSAAYQRSRLMNNIGLAFVQLGQYADAVSTFESALDMAPDHQVCASVHESTPSCMLSAGHLPHCAAATT